MPKIKPLARLADNLLGGSLVEFIDSRRDLQKSWDTIAKELWVATGHEIDVTGVTVQAWATAYGVDTAPRQPAGDAA